MEKLTQQEEEVMLYIWNLQECYVKDIVAKFPEPHPPYTTVASIVNNLKRKGYVQAKRYGNTYMYTPLIRQNRQFVQGNGFFLCQGAKTFDRRFERHHQLD